MCMRDIIETEVAKAAKSLTNQTKQLISIAAHKRTKFHDWVPTCV